MNMHGLKSRLKNESLLCGCIHMTQSQDGTKEGCIEILKKKFKVIAKNIKTKISLLELHGIQQRCQCFSCHSEMSVTT